MYRTLEKVLPGQAGRARVPPQPHGAAQPAISGVEAAGGLAR